MSNETKIAFDLRGLPPENAQCLIVWGHGWGMNREAFAPYAETLAGRAAHLVVDFPGFGASPVPPLTWGTAEYADALAALIRPYRFVKKILYVGHSFGGRVGIQLASRHPDLVDGLFLVGAHGLIRKRSLWKRIKMNTSVYTFKTLKHLAPFLGLSVDDLRRKFGSPDYRNAGAMRTLFLGFIREDLSAQVRQIKCPAQLVYGANDTETPPEIGQRLQKLIPNAALTILPDQDHYTVLGAGRHVVIKRVADFMEKLA